MNALLERLADLSLVEIDALVGGADGEDARLLIGAYVADLEDALAEARATLRDTHARLGAGADPLALVERGAEARSRAGEGAFAEVSLRLATRAQARLELAQLDERVRRVLPRLLEADRRLVALGGA